MLKKYIFLIFLVSPSSPQSPDDNNDRQEGCIFPANPNHGTYATNVPNGIPGEIHNYIKVDVTCQQNYVTEGEPSVYCFEGWWSNPLPKCVLSPQSTQIVVDDTSDRQESCIFPANPNYGTYVTNVPNGIPGEIHKYIKVDVTCQQNYVTEGEPSVYCFEGWWSNPLPVCVLSSQSAQSAADDVSDRIGGGCIMPPYPEHGTYESNVNGKSGYSYDFLTINVTCDQGYYLVGSESSSCFKGWWVKEMPICAPAGVVLQLATSLPITTSFAEISWQNGDSCILPPYPKHGTYTSHDPGAKPGQAYSITAINLTCHERYVLNGPHLVHCFGGLWSAQIPRCVLRCRLSKHPSIRFRCTISEDPVDGLRDCKEYEPSGTVAMAECRDHYRPTITHSPMRCKDGEWSDQVQKCTPECGILTPDGLELILNGGIAKYGEVPWHTAIYKQVEQSYKLICGGSLISTSVVITAAHCIWDNLLGRLSPSEFILALGKLHREFNNQLDHPQWSKVKSIQIPARFRGSVTSFQDDIALMELSTPVEYRPHILPVCVDFEDYFEARQLQPGNKGKVAGWGFTTPNGNVAEVLRVVELPYVAIETCINKSPASFSPFITSDKFCAGFHNEITALCRGDSGGGLAFPSLDKGKSRYYLRGIVSTAPTGKTECNPSVYTTFTRLIKHKRLILEHWRD